MFPCCLAYGDHAIQEKWSKNEIRSFWGLAVWIIKVQCHFSHPYSGTEFSDDWQGVIYVFCLPYSHLKLNQRTSWGWGRMGTEKNSRGENGETWSLAPECHYHQHFIKGITFLLLFSIDVFAVFISLGIFIIFILNPFQISILVLFSWVNFPMTWVDSCKICSSVFWPIY